MNQRRNTLYWVQKLYEEGYHPRTRDKKISSRWHLDSRDDKNVSGYYEMNYIHNEAWSQYLDLGMHNRSNYKKLYARLEDAYVKKRKRISDRKLSKYR